MYRKLKKTNFIKNIWRLRKIKVKHYICSCRISRQPPNRILLEFLLLLGKTCASEEKRQAHDHEYFQTFHASRNHIKITRYRKLIKISQASYSFCEFISRRLFTHPLCSLLGSSFIAEKVFSVVLLKEVCMKSFTNLSPWVSSM